MNLLLDTVTFLWWVTDDQRLSPKAGDLIKDPARRVFLSPVSVWEIAVKNSMGRLPLPGDPAALIPKLRADHGMEELPLTEGAVLQMPRLPSLHRDPFDRMLLGQAIEHGLILVTPDQELHRYPARIAW